MSKKAKLIVGIGVALLILIVLVAAGIRNHFMQDEQADKPKADSGYTMQAVYLKKEDGNNIFVELENDMPFTGKIPQEELYDENGEKITEQDLNNGDVLNIYGNGIMAQSYPGQYNGISKIERTEQENQEYIEEYSHFLDEFFVEKEPSQRPELNVCYTDDLAAVTVMIPEALGYTWTYEENGEGNTITTDAPHILQTNPTEVTKLSEPMKMELMFDAKPESVQILSWEDSLLGQYQDSANQIPDGTPVEIQENEEGNPEFTAQPGCVYLVQGQWENGTADYGFWTPSE
ncbi:hypothetical protein QVN96_11370 [Mediterraneibacter glycyrrhizinilyticus]|uniref:hypothetical protein n=1 Tax=Mediterraneibacter glycyrrhizinilyticus TaxID=342942 RepID=UPI0025AADC55|nr:hypothetical protein [Mediterraneibacter glycyrrhizinilyticus]MDN0061991.1 hypothetical protein [Mediterraneibacter glycyrrhizinilyticus]